MRQALLICFFAAFVNAASGQQWVNLGPCGSDTYGNHVAAQSGTGQVHCIFFDPDSQNIVYAGAPFGGLWKSQDSGKNWSNSNIDLDETMEFASVSDIAITKKSSVKTLWVASGHPGATGEAMHIFEPFSTGLYVSVNGGRNFKPVTSFNKKYGFQLSNKKVISRIVAHPTNPAILFVATSDGLYQTQDGGASWKLVLKGEDLNPTGDVESRGSAIFSVEFSKTDPDHIIYAGGTDIYRSVKGGKKGSFKTITHSREDLFGTSKDCLKTLTMNMELNSDSGSEVMYVAAFIKGDTCGAYKHKTDYNIFYFNGQTWARKGSPSFPVPDGIRLKMASVPGQPNIIYAGSATVSMSLDYGKTWKQVMDYNQPGHADIHAIKNIPGTADILAGTDGGIFKYSFNDKKTEERNNGLCLGQVIDMGTSFTNPHKIIIGMQDVGADIWDGKEWTKIPGSGDGYYGQLIDNSNEKNFFTTHNSTFFHNTSEKIALQLCNVCNQGGPIAFAEDPVHPNIYYYTRRDVYKSTDSAKTWCRVSDFSKKGLFLNPNGQVLYDLEIAPSNPDIIFTSYNAYPGSCTSFLFKSVTGGSDCEGSCSGPVGPDGWTVINVPAIETGDGQKNFQVNSRHFISTIAISDKSTDKFWLGYTYTDLDDPSFKVYKTDDNGTNWTKDDAGLPDYPVTKLVYVKGSNDELFAGTWNGVYHKKGNGSWEKFGTGLPHVFVSDMEINYTIHKLRVSTFGRGVWEIDLP